MEHSGTGSSREPSGLTEKQLAASAYLVVSIRQSAAKGVSAGAPEKPHKECLAFVEHTSSRVAIPFTRHPLPLTLVCAGSVR